METVAGQVQVIDGRDVALLLDSITASHLSWLPLLHPRDSCGRMCRMRLIRRRRDGK
jgi:hypothetical protein